MIANLIRFMRKMYNNISKISYLRKYKWSKITLKSVICG